MTFITVPHGEGPCRGCGRIGEEMRLNYCWDCATAGEANAARRTVAQHLGAACRKLHRPRVWWQARIDLKWAWERATRTGDYKPGGEFEGAGYFNQETR